MNEEVPQATPPFTPEQQPGVSAPPSAEARLLDGTLVDQARPIGGDPPVPKPQPKQDDHVAQEGAVHVPAPSADVMVYPPAVPPASGEAAVIATCWLQPSANYADAGLVQIGFGSTITVLEDVERDDHNRPWRKVTFEGQSGWIQQQNIRPA